MLRKSKYGQKGCPIIWNLFGTNNAQKWHEGYIKMTDYTENCMVCGSPLVYYESSQEVNCHICDVRHNTNVTCQDGHYICDACHAEKGLSAINAYAMKTHSRNPVLIATEIMKNQAINMHGPEHHYLVVAALLAAHRNAGGTIDFNKALHNAGQRAKKVPGGICGMWGSCGAGIAAGIFISIITGATPLSEKEWSLANQMTSKCLAVIAENGGPRCCKRDTYLTIFQAVAFVKDQFGIIMELPEQVTCEFSYRNKQCKTACCPFYFHTLQ